jgi:hypothetical protein
MRLSIELRRLGAVRRIRGSGTVPDPLLLTSERWMRPNFPGAAHFALDAMFTE